MNELKVGDVLILHLLTGTHVIGKIEGQTEDGFILNRPCDFIARRNDETQSTDVGFAPWLTLGGSLPAFESAVVPYNAILMPREAPAKIATGYLTAVSGIQIVGSMPAGKSSLIR